MRVRKRGKKRNWRRFSRTRSRKESSGKSAGIWNNADLLERLGRDMSSFPAGVGLSNLNTALYWFLSVTHVSKMSLHQTYLYDIEIRASMLLLKNKSIFLSWRQSTASFSVANNASAPSLSKSVPLCQAFLDFCLTGRKCFNWGRHRQHYTTTKGGAVQDLTLLSSINNQPA